MEKNNRILIVDDQQDLREQLAKLLLRSGKKNETVSLVQQMRSRLLGNSDSDDDDGDDFVDDAYDVTTVGQGEDAFEAVKKANAEGKPFALMFLDMRMPPGWDGLETAVKIREIDKSIEIVIMTAYADHDQMTIAERVGTPEKLLYIKKPFQTEEIYQLALSLTSKWDSEQKEKERKKWSEILIRSITKIKSIFSSKSTNIYETVLLSIVPFTKSTKGIIIYYNEDDNVWRLKNSLEVSDEDAQAFITEHAEFLSEARTTQKMGEKYIIPLNREGFKAMVVLYDSHTESDPEWYKLLTLMVMSASEALAQAVLQHSSTVGNELEDNVKQLETLVQEIENKENLDDSIVEKLNEMKSILATMHA